MNRPIMILTAGLLIQEPADQDLRLKSEVRLVLLDVSVERADGQPVAGLGRAAFQVFDAGERRELAAFAGEDAPVTVGLVIDASASMRSRHSDVRTAAGAFIDESNPADEMFLVSFSDDVTASPPESPPGLRGRVAGLRMAGRTALFDGISKALDQLGLGTRERKALVLISDGRDTASQLKRVELMRKLASLHATVYTIGLRGDAGEMDSVFLREIAHATGGDTHLDVSAQELPEICRRIARGIRARYLLAFHGATTAKPETRRIRVEVRGPGLKVVARRSYTTVPAPASEVRP